MKKALEKDTSQEHWHHNCKRCGSLVTKWLFDLEPNLYEILGATRAASCWSCKGQFLACRLWCLGCPECKWQYCLLAFAFMAEKSGLSEEWLAKVMDPEYPAEGEECVWLTTDWDIDDWLVAKFETGNGPAFRHFVGFIPIDNLWDQMTDVVRQVFPVARKWAAGKRVMKVIHDPRKTRKAMDRLQARFGWGAGTLSEG